MQCNTIQDNTQQQAAALHCDIFFIISLLLPLEVAVVPLPKYTHTISSHTIQYNTIQYNQLNKTPHRTQYNTIQHNKTLHYIIYNILIALCGRSRQARHWHTQGLMTHNPSSYPLLLFTSPPAPSYLLLLLTSPLTPSYPLLLLTYPPSPSYPLLHPITYHTIQYDTTPHTMPCRAKPFNTMQHNTIRLYTTLQQPLLTSPPTRGRGRPATEYII